MYTESSGLHRNEAGDTVNSLKAVFQLTLTEGFTSPRTGSSLPSAHRTPSDCQ